jgi:hypothetical protein
MTETDPHLDENALKSRAFELWQSRGCPLGSPEIDWYEAQQGLAALLDDRAHPEAIEQRTESSGEPESTSSELSPLVIRRLRNGLLYVGNGAGVGPRVRPG